MVALTAERKKSAGIYVVEVYCETMKQARDVETAINERLGLRRTMICFDSVDRAQHHTRSEVAVSAANLASFARPVHSRGWFVALGLVLAVLAGFAGGLFLF